MLFKWSEQTLKRGKWHLTMHLMPLFPGLTTTVCVCVCLRVCIYVCACKLSFTYTVYLNLVRTIDKLFQVEERLHSWTTDLLTTVQSFS